MKNLLISLLFMVQLFQTASAEELSYSGRLVNANGSPVTGLVDLKFDVAYSGAPTVIICTKTASGVALANGVFHVSLDFENSDCVSSKAFADVLSDVPANESVILQVTDSTNNKVYPHQALKSVPFSIQASIAKTIHTAVAPAEGQILKWISGKWTPAADGGGSGSVTEIQTGSGLSGGPITSTGTISIETNGVTSSHILDGTISNADINASAGIARSKIAGSLANHVVINDGAGLLSAVSHLPVNLGGTGAGTASDARNNLGLGNVATRDVGLNSGNVLLADEVPSCLAHQKIQKTALAPYIFSCADDNDSADASKLPLLGGTMLGAINMGGFAITNLVDPTNPQDAATRNYVHNYVASELLGVSESQWVNSGSDIYFSNRVGIGAVTPTQKLDVIGNIFLGSNEINSRQLQLYGRDSAGSNPIISYHAAVSNPLIIATTANNNNISLMPHGVGKVGVGTTNPNYPLTVLSSSNGAANFQSRSASEPLANNYLVAKNPTVQIVGGDENENHSGLVSIIQPGYGSSSARAGSLSLAISRSTTAQLNSGIYTATQNGDNLGFIMFGGDNGSNLRTRGAEIVGVSDGLWSSTSSPGSIIFKTTPTGTNNATDVMRITSSGRVGIGTSNPGTKLEVAGQVKITGGSPGAGKVLTSDGSGLATWENPSAPTTGSINSSHILDGSIVDADINASAAIAQSKIANLTTDLAGKQASDPDLAAIAALSSYGILVRNSDNSFVTRTLVGAAGRTFVSNDNGASGNPTINISNALLPSPLIGDAGKFLKATGADTSAWSALTSGDIATALGFTPINKAGDTMTGALTLSGAPTANLHAATKQYVDTAAAAANPWSLSSGNVYRSSGNVGIGTASPTKLLTVTNLATPNCSVGGNGICVDLNGGGGIYMSDSAAGLQSKYESYANTMGIGTISNHPVLIFSNNVERVRINNLGNVGIGTSNPTSALQIGGGMNAGDIVLRAGSSLPEDSGDLIFQNNSGTQLGRVWADPISTGGLNLSGRSTNTSDIFLATSGNIGIGTKTPGSATKLNVEGQIRSKSFSTTTGAIDWSNGNAGTTSFDCGSAVTFANLRDGGSYTLVVTGTGTTACSFSNSTTGDDAATVNYRFLPVNGNRAASSHTVYSLQRIGSTVYVSWMTGF